MYQNFDLRYFMKRSDCWLATITFFPIDMLACSQKKRTENLRMNEQAHAICADGLAAWEGEKMTPYTNLRNELGEK